MGRGQGARGEGREATSTRRPQMGHKDPWARWRAGEAARKVEQVLQRAARLEAPPRLPATPAPAQGAPRSRRGRSRAPRQADWRLPRPLPHPAGPWGVRPPARPRPPPAHIWSRRRRAARLRLAHVEADLGVARRAVGRLLGHPAEEGGTLRLGAYLSKGGAVAR